MSTPSELRAKIKDKELHRITTTTLVYKLDKDKQFTYLITRRALHKKAHPGMWTIPGGGLSIDDYIDSPQSEHGENLWYNVLEKSLKREIKEEVGLDIGKPELLVDIFQVKILNKILETSHSWAGVEMRKKSISKPEHDGARRGRRNF